MNVCRRNGPRASTLTNVCDEMCGRVVESVAGWLSGWVGEEVRGWEIHTFDRRFVDRILSCSLSGRARGRVGVGASGKVFGWAGRWRGVWVGGRGGESVGGWMGWCNEKLLNDSP